MASCVWVGALCTCALVVLPAVQACSDDPVQGFEDGGVDAGADAVSSSDGNVETLPPREPGFDILFRQDVLTSASEVHASGCRLSRSPTAGYLSPSIPKATVSADNFSFGGANAALVCPSAGILSRDEFTITMQVQNTSGVELTQAPLEKPQVLFVGNAIAVWRAIPSELTVVNFATTQTISIPIGLGDWPSGVTKSVTLSYRRGEAGPQMWARLGDDVSKRRFAAAPTKPESIPASYAPPGILDGFEIGGTAGGAYPFAISGTFVHRYFWPEGTPVVREVPTLSVNLASASSGPSWSTIRAGALALYEGFEEVPRRRGRQSVRSSWRSRSTRRSYRSSVLRVQCNIQALQRRRLERSLTTSPSWTKSSMPF